MQHLSPAPARLDVVDALRGFALFGIIIVHFLEEFYAGPPPVGHENYTHVYAFDGIAEGIASVLIRGKFFMLFSFLFGLSFSLQMNRSEQRGNDYRLRFAWRMLLLFFIGAFHNCFFRGDILAVYAMLGLPLLLFRDAPARVLLIAAGLMMLGAPRALLMAWNPQYDLQAVSNAMQATETHYWAVATGPSFAALAWENTFYGFAQKMIFQFEYVGRGYQTFALFLLGLYAGKIHFFENISEKRALYRKGLFWSLGSIAGLIFLGLILFGVFKIHERFGQSVQMFVGITLFDLLNFCQTALYIFGFLLLFRLPGTQKRLLRLAPVGRMALTNYVMQSIVGAAVYFGFGLGMLGKMGATRSLIAALVLFILQQIWSKWMLERYRYGPLEWLWRSATLLQRQAFKK